MKIILALILLVTISASPTRADGEMTAMTLLGVDSNQQAVPTEAQPVQVAPESAPVAAAPDGSRVALIVRGSNFGIHPYVQQFVARLASSLGGDTRMQAFLQENLEKTYLSDEKAAKAQLEGAGYTVKILTSAELGGDPAGFKAAVLAELEKKETALFMFYGHGSPWGIQLWGGREHQAPGPAEIQAALEGRNTGDAGLSPDEINAALAKRGDAGKLDAMILHCCRGGTEPYTKGKGSWAECVKDGNRGFFAGWVTYATYFTPGTAAILSACFAHLKAVGAGGAADELTKTARYYTKSGPMLRKMSLLAGLDDEHSIADEFGYDFAKFEADATVHEHGEPQITALKGIEALINLAYALKYGKSGFGSDLKDFVVAYTAYAKEAGLDQSRNGRPAPAMSSPPTRAEVNAMLAHQGPAAIAEGLSALLPGLLVLKYGRIWVDDQDLLQLDLSIDVNNAKDVDTLLDILSGAFLPRAATAVAGALPPLVGTDGLTGGTHVFGMGIGAELASRVRGTIATVRERLPRQVLALKLRMSLEKVSPAGAWIGAGADRKRAVNSVRPLVYGYNLAVGDVPQAKKDSTASPYEIHVALKSVNDVVKPLVMGMLGDEIELQYIYNPGRLLPNITLYAYTKMTRMGDITGSGSTLSCSGTAQLRVNWGPFGDGYAYATVTGSATVSTPGDLTIGIAPTATLSGVSGLPGPQWLQNIFVGLAQSQINASIARAIPGTIDIATLIPAQYRSEIVGKVKISKVEVVDGVLSVYMDRP